MARRGERSGVRRGPGAIVRLSFTTTLRNQSASRKLASPITPMKPDNTIRIALVRQSANVPRAVGSDETPQRANGKARSAAR